MISLKAARRSVYVHVKRSLPVEEQPIRKMGKKLVAARALDAGHVLEAEDLAIKSPADGGLRPYELDRIVGNCEDDGDRRGCRLGRQS